MELPRVWEPGCRPEAEGKAIPAVPGWNPGPEGRLGGEQTPLQGAPCTAARLGRGEGGSPGAGCHWRAAGQAWKPWVRDPCGTPSQG